MADDFSLMRWCGKLGGIRQFRDVEYVSHQGNTVACALCGTGWMNRDQRIHHFHGGRHEMRYNAVQNLEASINRSKEIAQRFDQVGTMRYEASCLKLDRWKHHVGSLLLEHVEGKPDILATAKRQIDAYKQLPYWSWPAASSIFLAQVSFLVSKKYENTSPWINVSTT